MAAAEKVVCGRSSRTSSRRVVSVRIYVASSLPVDRGAALAGFLVSYKALGRAGLLGACRNLPGARPRYALRPDCFSTLHPPEVGFRPQVATRENLRGVSERLDSIDTGGPHRPPRPTVSGVPGAADRGLRMWKEHMSDASTDMTAPELSNSPCGRPPRAASGTAPGIRPVDDAAGTRGRDARPALGADAPFRR